MSDSPFLSVCPCSLWISTDSANFFFLNHALFAKAATERCYRCQPIAMVVNDTYPPVYRDGVKHQVALKMTVKSRIQGVSTIIDHMIRLNSEVCRFEEKCQTRSVMIGRPYLKTKWHNSQPENLADCLGSANCSAWWLSDMRRQLSVSTGILTDILKDKEFALRVIPSKTRPFAASGCCDGFVPRYQPLNCGIQKNKNLKNPDLLSAQNRANFNERNAYAYPQRLLIYCYLGQDARELGRPWASAGRHGCRW